MPSVSNSQPSGPEAALLLACARAGSDAAHSAEVRDLARQESLDWERLLKLAERHSLSPLLHWRLSQDCPEAVPLPILETLKNHSQANAQRNLLLTGELLRILAL